MTCCPIFTEFRPGKGRARRRDAWRFHALHHVMLEIATADGPPNHRANISKHLPLRLRRASLIDLIEHPLNVATVKLCQLDVAYDRKHVSAETLRQMLAGLDGASVFGDVAVDQHG